MSTTIRTAGLFDRHLSPRRFIKLLRADLIQYRSSLSIAATAVFGATLVLLTAFAPLSGGWQPHLIFLPGILFIGGLLITSYSFAELGDPVRRAAYLLVPASTFEKVAARLLLTLVAYPLAVLALYWLISLVAAGVGDLVWGRSFAVYNPFTAETWRLLTVYPMVHAIFFLGAVWFRKGAAFKTVLAVVAAQIGFVIVAGFILRIVFSGFFEGFSFTPSMDIRLKLIDAGWLTSDIWAQIGRLLTYLLFGPWFWVISYHRLADTESR